MTRSIVRFLSLPAATLVVGACSDGPTNPDDRLPQIQCTLDMSFFASGGVPRNGIPALTDPPTTTLPNTGALDYLDPRDRVVGVHLDGRPLAIPLNILYHHEIVNLNGQSGSIAVTYCPLTGSSLAFDRSVVGGAEFGVSGLLYQSNLIMFDRVTQESLWPQMFAAARCGPRDGQVIPRVKSVEMTWEGWQTLYPDTEVLTTDTGFERDYTDAGNPYNLYEATSEWWFPMPPANPALPGKRRVLGIPDGAEGGIALSFSLLAGEGTLLAVPLTVADEDVVVFWETASFAAAAYFPRADGQALTFEVVDEAIRDVETGSEWSLDGMAVSGTMAGAQLETHPTAYTAFWRAWAAFSPDTEVWQPPTS